METSIERMMKAADDRRMAYRSAASGTLSREASGGGSPYGPAVPSVQPFLSQDVADAAKQYKAIKKDWQYVAARPVAVKVADQSFKVGEKKKAAKPPAGKIVRKSFDMRRCPPSIKSLAEGIDAIEDHPLYDVFENPNSYMSGWALKYCCALSIKATGKAYIWIVKTMRPGPASVDGKPTESDQVESIKLYYLPATWVTPIHDKENGRPFVAWRILPAGAPEDQAVTVPYLDVIYVAFPDPADPLAAVSDLQTQARAINTDDEIQKSQQASMVNGIRPGVVLTAGRLENPPGMLAGQMPRPVLTAEQRKQLESAVRMAYAGAMHHGDPIIVDGMIESVTPWTLTPMDMDYPNGSQLTKDRIMQGMGTSPIVAGQGENANRAGSYEQHKIFYSLVVNPIITLLSEALTKWLSPIFSGADQKLYIWIEEAKADDAELDIEKMSLGIDAGVVRNDELREFMGLAPIGGPEGEKFVGADKLEIERMKATQPPLAGGAGGMAGAGRKPQGGSGGARGGLAARRAKRKGLDGGDSADAA